MSIKYELAEIEKLSELTPGTQIAVKSLFKNLNHWLLKSFYPLVSSEEYYYHHGVYLGEFEVAHFTGENQADAKPRKCDILQFRNGAADGKLYQAKYDDPNLLLPVAKTLEKAEDILAKPTEWPEFEIVRNNCESFATWLKTGEVVSAQAMKAMDRATTIGIAAGGLTGLGSVAIGCVKLS